MRIFKGLAGQTVIYGLGTIVPRLLNFLLLTPFYTRIFGCYQYGTISELYAYSSFLLVLLTMGMETTYFRFSVNNDERKTFGHTWLFTVVLSVLFLLITLIFNEGIASLINYTDNANYIIYFAFIVFFDVITAVPYARLRNQNKALKFVILKLINISVNIGLNVFFYVICKDSANQFLSNLYNHEIGIGYAFISNLVASAVSFLLILPELRGIAFTFDKAYYKTIFNYSWPLIIIGVAGMINETADKILIKFLTPENLIPLEQVGIYSANYKIAVIMTIFIQMFKYAAEPYFFQKSKFADAKDSYRIIMNYFVLFCLMIFLLVTLYIDIFKYFIDSSYHIGLHIVPIVLLANMFLGVYFNLSIWYKLTNNTKSGAVIALIGVVVTLVINVLCIPVYGYVAAAWATLVCYITITVVSYFWGNRVYKIDYDVRKILLYIALSILILLGRNLISTEGVAKNLFVSTIFGLLFVVIVYLAERKSLKKLYASKNN